MANTLTGNAWYVDTAYTSASDDLSGAYLVTGILLTSTTAALGRIVLSDPSTGSVKMDLKVQSLNGATTGDSRFYDFSNSPLAFPNGVRVTTLTTAVATLIGSQMGA